MKKITRKIGHDIIPHFCQIELTYACNADCIFCYNPENILIRDFKKTDQIVESVAKSQIPHVYLFGGEPSLFPVKKLNEYIEILSPHSSVTIVTNGIIRMEGISKKKRYKNFRQLFFVYFEKGFKIITLRHFVLFY